MDLRLRTLKAVSFIFAAQCFNFDQCRKLCVNTFPATKVTLITDGI
jgi:hypothetical protein